MTVHMRLTPSASPGYSLRAGEKIGVLTVNRGNLNPDQLDHDLSELMLIFGHMQMKLEYKSFYGETWTHGEDLP